MACKSPSDMAAAVIRNLPEKTGKSIDDWVKVAKRMKVAKGEITEFGAKPVLELRDRLVETHDLGRVTAQCIAWETLRPADFVETSDGALIDEQYSGAKADLRPIFDKVAVTAEQLGSDVAIKARKTQVTLARGSTFAIVRAATKSRVDLGLRIPSLADADDGRLEAGDHFSGNTTHRVRLTEVKDVDGELRRWMKMAYEARA